jgi:hypothetical protein
MIVGHKVGKGAADIDSHGIGHRGILPVVILVHRKVRRVGKVALHSLTAWAISAFTRVFDAAIGARRDFAHAVGIGEGAVARPTKLF